MAACLCPQCALSPARPQVAAYPINHHPARTGIHDLLLLASGRSFSGPLFVAAETLCFFLLTLAIALRCSDLGACGPASTALRSPCWRQKAAWVDVPGTMSLLLLLPPTPTHAPVRPPTHPPRQAPSCGWWAAPAGRC